MSFTKSKVIAVSSLAALAAVAAIALTTQPESESATPAAASASVKPRVKREVVHRVKHVQATPNEISTDSAAAAPAPQSVPAPAPVADIPGSEGDSYEDDSGESDDHAEYEDSETEAGHVEDD